MRLAIVLVLSACSVRSGTFTPLGDDGGGTSDGATIDAPPFVKPTPYSPAFAPMGPDQVHAVKAGPGGSWYVAGVLQALVSDPKSIFVSKVLETGLVDTGFGSDGIVVVSQTPTGFSIETDLAVQSDGKALVTFTISNPTDATDTDVAVARITTAGQLDTNFGESGIARIDFSSKGSSSLRDAAREIEVDSGNNIFILANAKAATTPDNTDFVLAKLDPSSGPLAGWGTGGRTAVETNVGGMPNNGTARSLLVLPDGSLVGGGYANVGLTSGSSPIYFKLGPTGTLVSSFANNGIFVESVLGNSTEIYSLAVSGTKVIAAGYGNEALGSPVIWYAFQFDPATGTRSIPWAGAANGAPVYDVSPGAASSQCREALALPGNRTLLLGSTGTDASQDGAFLVIDSNGAIEPHFGIQRFEFLPADDKNDTFWSADASGGKVLVAGWRGTNGAAQSAAVNDDAYWITFDLP